jgi:hypothetical protein
MVQDLQLLLEATRRARWLPQMRVAALQACYEALPPNEHSPALAAAAAMLSPSESVMLACKLGHPRALDPYRAAGARVCMRLWCTRENAFATRVMKLDAKLARATCRAAAQVLYQHLVMTMQCT